MYGRILFTYFNFISNNNRPFPKMTAENSDKLKLAKIKNVYQH